MGSSSAVTPEALLESLMNDGTIDAIRSKIINQLKANEELKNSTISMVEQSKVLNTSGAEKQTKRELFDALRRELESKVLEKASKSVWELILDNDGLGKEISETVERVYCRLGGRELPVLPPVNGNTSSEKDKENSNSSSRKRSFSAMNMQGADEVVNKPRSTPAVPEDSGKPKVVNHAVTHGGRLTTAVMKEVEAPYGGDGMGIRSWEWRWLAVVVVRGGSASGTKQKYEFLLVSLWDQSSSSSHHFRGSAMV